MLDLRKTGSVLLMLCLFICGFTGKIPLTPYAFPELKFFPRMPVASNNPVTVEGARLGRFLFYDPVLSSDSTISCASCHHQKMAFSDGPDSFSKGRNGTLMKRNTLPLFNLAWYPTFFWDGRVSGIEEQVFHPVREYDEMNLDWKSAADRLEKIAFYKNQFREIFGRSRIDSVQISFAIAQFLRTLLSYQSKYDRVLMGKELFTKDEFEGFNLVNDQTKGDCIHCHSTDGNVLGTTLVFTNNGLDAVSNAEDYKDKGRGAVTGKSEDLGKFMVPSLRNLAFTAPFMHDGRFKTLEEVVDFYSEGVKQCANIDSKMEYVRRGGVNLTIEEKRKVIAFLFTLSDSSFISDPEFGNPFLNLVGKN